MSHYTYRNSEYIYRLIESVFRMPGCTPQVQTKTWRVLIDDEFVEPRSYRTSRCCRHGRHRLRPIRTHRVAVDCNTARCPIDAAYPSHGAWSAVLGHPDQVDGDHRSIRRERERCNSVGWRVGVINDRPTGAQIRAAVVRGYEAVRGDELAFTHNCGRYFATFGFAGIR